MCELHSVLYGLNAVRGLCLGSLLSAIIECCDERMFCAKRDCPRIQVRKRLLFRRQDVETAIRYNLSPAQGLRVKHNSQTVLRLDLASHKAAAASVPTLIHTVALAPVI